MASEENRSMVDIELSDSAHLTPSPARVLSDASLRERLFQVVVAFLPLGCVTFGGPTAHIALLHSKFVEGLGWLSDEEFLELMAVGQGLPGPTSTQMVVAIATHRAGIFGGLIAFSLFSFPGFIVCTLAGLGIDGLLHGGSPAWLDGVAPAAVSLVFMASFKLTAKVNDTKLKHALTITTAIVTLFLNGDKRVDSKVSAWVFPLMLSFGGLTSFLHARFVLAPPPKINMTPQELAVTGEHIGITMRGGIAFAVAWAAVLIVSLSAFDKEGNGGLFRALYRIGSIIYGGGQVVLPMLIEDVVDPGWVSNDQFLQGFALAQALPGPLFNFAAYLGAVYRGVPGAVVAFLGLFGPGVILIFAFLPFWRRVRQLRWFIPILNGVNAAALGLLVAACVLLWRSAVLTFSHAMVFLFAGYAQIGPQWPAPVCILAGGVLGYVLSKDALNLAQLPY